MRPGFLVEWLEDALWGALKAEEQRAQIEKETAAAAKAAAEQRRLRDQMAMKRVLDYLLNEYAPGVPMVIEIRRAELEMSDELLIFNEIDKRLLVRTLFDDRLAADSSNHIQTKKRWLIEAIRKAARIAERHNLVRKQ